jgi:hypothetical protein
MMERTEILAAMGGLKLFGMRSAYDEIVATAVKRQHEPQRVVGDLLAAELSEKQARSIKYQITVAKLPLAKEIEDLQRRRSTRRSSAISPAVASCCSSATSHSSAAPGPARRTSRSASPAPASAAARGGASSRRHLVNKLEAEARSSRQGRLADHLARLDFVVLDELGYLPLAQAGGQLLFHLISRLYEQTSVIVTTNSPSANGRPSSAIRR